MRIGGVVMVGGIIAAAAVAGWLLLRGSDSQTPARDPAGRVARANLGGAPSLGADAANGAVPWMGEPGMAPRRVAGVVVGGDAPVVGATVRVLSPGLAHPPERVTGQDGAFDMGAFNLRSAMLTVTADGRAPHTTQLHLANPSKQFDDLRIELEPCTLSEPWTVVNAAQQPVSTAEFRVHQTHDGGVLSGGSEIIANVHADAEGKARLCVNMPGWSEYAVAAEGYGTAWLRSDTVAAGGVVQLSDAGTLTGKVVDTEGTPIAHAYVAARAPRPLRGGSTYSDADGAFTISGLQPALYSVSAWHQAFSGETDDFDKTIVRAGTNPPVTLTLQNNFVAAGMVVQGNEPVVGVPVGIKDCASRTTQADGSFVTWCEPLDDARSVTVRGYDVLGTSELVLDREVDDLLVEVAPLPSIQGTVRFDGVPVVGAVVGVESNKDRRLGGLFRFEMAATSEADGTYALHVKPGEYPIGAFHKERGLGASSVAVQVTGRGAVAHDIELHVRGTIRGSVVGADGRPVPSARVTLDGAILPADLDDQGRFRLIGLEFGHHEVMVEQQVGDRWDDKAITRDVNVSAEAPVAVVDVVLDVSGRRLSGTVRYDDGTVIPGARVRTGGSEPTLTDAHGNFEATVYCAANCSVVAETPFDEGKREPFDKRTRHIDIEIPRSGSIVGTVVAPTGTVVTATLDDGSDRARMMKMVGGSRKATVRNDQFTFPSIPPGTYSLEASIDQKVATAVAEVRPAQQTRVTMGEQEGTLIFGRAIDHLTQTPVTGATCGVNITRGARSDGAGEFQLKALRAPDTVLIICKHEMRFGSTIVELQPATAAEVEVQIVSEPGDLGAELDGNEDGSAIVFSEVSPDGPAHAVGIQKGDQLVAVDGLTATAATPLGAYLYLETRPPRSRLQLRYRRDGRDRDVAVDLGEGRPSKFGQ